MSNMTQYKAERRLAWLYSLIVALAIITSVCTAVAWAHWKDVLNFCYERTCGCILYGRTTSAEFEGGHRSSCIWAVFGPLPVIGYALVMAGYHLIRVCINNIGKYEEDPNNTIEQREGEIVMMSVRSEVRSTSSVVYCWIPAAVISSMFAVYCLVHASILTDGYYKSCNQYRGHLVKTLHASGDHVNVIYSRLSCQAIFDFMDYLQPEISIVLDSRRNDYINTGLSLQMAIACSWIQVFVFIYIAIINSVRAHKERNVLTCCGK